MLSAGVQAYRIRRKGTSANDARAADRRDDACGMPDIGAKLDGLAGRNAMDVTVLVRDAVCANSPVRPVVLLIEPMT